MEDVALLFSWATPRKMIGGNESPAKGLLGFQQGYSNNVFISAGSQKT